MKRRQFLWHAGWGLAICSAPQVMSASSEDRPGIDDATARVSPAQAFDKVMREYMDKLDIPGGALAVLRHGRLAYARGYGWADRERNIEADPQSLFRIASLSKPITALAILKLIEEKRLDPREPVFESLELHRLAPSDESFDKRWRDVTVEHLLHHTGGWDRDQSFDPMFRPRVIAKQFDIPSPAGPREVIRYMLGQPLDFDPGQRYAYSNFGYCLLGRLIEKATGETYEAYVRRAVLRPAGCGGMRLGRTLMEERAEGEVRYYIPNDRETDCVFDSHPGRCLLPYGGFHLEAMDAHGGWLASVDDLARLTAAMEPTHPRPFLGADSWARLRRPPPAPAWRNEEGVMDDHYYGCGWMVRPTGGQGRANYWHAGSLPGTTALWVRRHDGISYVALFNQRTRDWRTRGMNIDPMLYRAADRVDWD